MEKNSRQPNIGADVEHAISIAQLDAVLQVATRNKHLVVNETRFISIRGTQLQTSRRG